MTMSRRKLRRRSGMSDGWSGKRRLDDERRIGEGGIRADVLNRAAVDGGQRYSVMKRRGNGPCHRRRAERARSGRGGHWRSGRRSGCVEAVRRGRIDNCWIESGGNRCSDHWSRGLRLRGLLIHATHLVAVEGVRCWVDALRHLAKPAPRQRLIEDQR